MNSAFTHKPTVPSGIGWELVDATHNLPAERQHRAEGELHRRLREGLGGEEVVRFAQRAATAMAEHGERHERQIRRRRRARGPGNPRAGLRRFGRPARGCPSDRVRTRPPAGLRGGTVLSIEHLSKTFPGTARPRRRVDRDRAGHRALPGRGQRLGQEQPDQDPGRRLPGRSGGHHHRRRLDRAGGADLARVGPLGRACTSSTRTWRSSRC